MPESGLGTGFSLWGCVILSLGICGSLSVGLGHPGQWGVLVSGCVDLVWVQDLPSGVVLISGCLSLVPASGSLSGDVRLSGSVGRVHPGQRGVLVSDLDLVWVQDLPSGVV